MSTVNTTSHDDFIPEVWAQTALGYLKNTVELAGVVDRAEDYGVSDIGDVVNIRKRGSLTSNDMTEGTDSTINSTSGSKVPIQIDNQKEVVVGETDIYKALSDPSGRQLDGYMRDAAKVLAEDIETSILNLYTGFTAGDINDTVNDTNIEDIMLKARKNLISNLAPTSESFYTAVSPDFYNHLLSSPRFTEVEKYGPNVSILDGELGRIFNFRVVEHTALPIVSGSPDVYQNVYMHPGAIVLAMREFPEVSEGYGVQSATVQQDGLSLRVMKYYSTAKKQEVVSVDAIWGVGLVRPDWAGVIKQDIA